MTWKPRKKTQRILNLAMVELNAVDYTPSARWVYYQVVQKHNVPKTKRGYENFLYAISEARKNFYEEWHPATLVDNERNAWVRGIYSEKKIQQDRIRGQKNYVEIWFEANAMFQQFVKYTMDEYITLVPFKGDPSIPFKWEIAKRLQERHKKYSIPIHILYFGDCDTKGSRIPYDALKDIEKWSQTDFNFHFCGLTLRQAKEYNIPENPEKPNEYQWEALSDKRAGNIITGNIRKYWKTPET